MTHVERQGSNSAAPPGPPEAAGREDIDYRLVVDSTPALVFSARPDGYVDYFNQRWLDYLGVPGVGGS